MNDYRRFPDPKRQLAEILAGRATGTPRVKVAKPKRYGPPGMLTKPLTLTFPLPPKEVSPNHTNSAHWTRTCKAKRKYKEIVLVGCMVQNVPSLLLDAAEVQATFYWRTNRRRDYDNAAASLKGLWDSLVIHGLFRDDHGLRHLPIEMQVDKTNPRLEVTLTSRP